MKFTMSRDGQPRADIRVKHRIGLREIVNLVCLYLVTEGEYESGQEVQLTRSGVEAAVRRILRQEGDETPDYWKEKVYSDTDADELEAQVRAEVLRLYPELGS